MSISIFILIYQWVGLMIFKELLRIVKVKKLIFPFLLKNN